MSSISFLSSQTRRAFFRQASRLHSSPVKSMSLPVRELPSLFPVSTCSYKLEHTSALLRYSHTWTQTVQDAECLIKHPGGSYINPDTLIGEDVSELGSSMSDWLDLEHPLLRTMSKYYLEEGYNHIHPLIVLMMSRAVNGSELKDKLQNGILPEQRSLSEITEMIHTASLIHDDVLDYSMSESTPETAKAAKGNKLSVLGGDFLLTRASMGLARLRVPEVVELIALAIENQVKGEFMKATEAVTEKSLNFERCLDQIYLKHASLMANSCKAAAILGRCESKVINSAYLYGKELGIAIKLHQDVQEWKTAIEEKKSDFKPSIFSGPLILAMETHEALKISIKHGSFESNSDVFEMYDIIRQTKAIERTSEIVESCCQKAIDIARSFPTSDAQQILIKLPQSMSGKD
ncbi:coq1 putative hexaprenyl diphosphate synthase [Basidiobolus ranarum]|uniref:Coq1 putative hexaprenyl diphosphate synthase n=1 Tax=Basidiobolus ranarum TaxID=34480 RepID=A0ABR2WR67_9FUNG